MSNLSIVVPTFNEADNVGALVEQLQTQLREIDAEIVFVDDSTDDTPQVIRRLALEAGIRVRVIHRELPVGRLAGAVVAGIAATESPWVVVMDGDLQHPPSAVPALYRQALLGGSDVVVASRYLGTGDASGLGGTLRKLVSSWSCRAAKLLFPRRLAACSDPMSGFFAVRREALQLDAVTQCGYKILLAFLIHRQLAISEVPFHFGERNAGKSKASLREGLRYLQLLLLLRATPGLLFAAVGASGALPNLAAVAILTGLHVNYLLAAVIAIQLAILWNFAGAELIVFRDRRSGKLWHRALRFVAASETDLLRLPFVVLLAYGGVSSLPATAITLLLAVALRYYLASRLVYGRRPSAVAPSAVPAAMEPSI